MVTGLQKIDPREIEAQSFRIIEQELGPASFSGPEFAIVRRVIHATADFSFADSIRFHPDAVRTGIGAIRAGKDILMDVHMAAAGVSRRLLRLFGCKVICRISDPEVESLAREQGRTRAETAIELGLGYNTGIVAIGNAPTALMRIMDIMGLNKTGPRPDLVIGVPVGFVNASESKELLCGTGYPFITSLGRKGGSPVAAAIVNALLRLAAEE